MGCQLKIKPTEGEKEPSCLKTRHINLIQGQLNHFFSRLTATDNQLGILRHPTELHKKPSETRLFQTENMNHAD
jgi:hypothetical protein